MSTLQWGASGLPAVHTEHGPARSFLFPLTPHGLGSVTVLDVRAAGDTARRTHVIAAGAPVGVPDSAPPRGLPVDANDTIELWLAAPRCPAPAVLADRFDVRVRNRTGTHRVPLHLEPAARLRCVR